TQVDFSPAEETDADVEEPAETAKAAEKPESDQTPAKAESDQTQLLPAVGEVGEESSADTGDPAVEATAPADAELVAKLDVEVVVVDEYPRYHVSECGWLGDRDTIPI